MKMLKKRILAKRKLDPLKRIYRKLRLYHFTKASGAIGMTYWCIIMSLVIVKVSSTAELYQNQTELEQANSLSESQESDTVTSASATATKATTKTTISPESENSTESESATQAANYRQIEEMRAKLQQQQQLLQRQYEQQQQRLHAIASETSYLLERGDDSSTTLERERERDREQPIYGTWRTKARRPLSLPLVAIAPSTTTTAGAAVLLSNHTSATSLEAMQQHQKHQQQQQQNSAPAVPASTVPIVDNSHERMHHELDPSYQHHLYERLPKRAATMTPLTSDLHDQLPRPPRLTTRRPASVLVRRQYSETPGSLMLRDDFKPKPFHFPYDGQIPEQFKKVVGERPEINNIQDILQQLHISGAHTSKVPPMLMMPTGLHIAGSFKNLKSSGIANFFRNKRHKPQMQFTIPIPMPMPMQMLGGYHPPPGAVLNALGHPHQRISMDQVYQFKPRSPNDINLLAIQPNTVSKKKKKKQKQKQKPPTSNSNSNFILEQHGMLQPHFAADNYLSHFPPIIAINATRQPKMKRVPFKLNLDIYPVMPPSKDFKGLPFTLDEAKLVQPSRPGSALRNPIGDYGPYSLTPSVAALTAATPSIYAPFRFPASSHAPLHFPQASNAHVVFPDQMNKYNQRLAQKQHQQQPHHQHQGQPQQQRQQLQQYQYPQLQQYPFNYQQKYANMQQTTADCEHPSSPGDGPNSNQIMVHLNVFPKQLKSTTAPSVPYRPSTNPFYANLGQIQRHTISEENEHVINVIEPRQIQHQQQNHQQQHQSQQQQNQPQQQQHQQQQAEHHQVQHSAANATEIQQHHQLQQRQLQQQQQYEQHQQYQQQQQQHQQKQHQQQQNYNQSISRSDNFEVEPLIDFEHPIVAAEMPAALVGNHLGISNPANSQHVSAENHNSNNNFRYNSNTNIDQIASEAKAASLFRFPVEDLIQFQVDDAM